MIPAHSCVFEMMNATSVGLSIHLYNKANRFNWLEIPVTQEAFHSGGSKANTNIILKIGTYFFDTSLVIVHTTTNNPTENVITNPAVFRLLFNCSVGNRKSGRMYTNTSVTIS